MKNNCDFQGNQQKKQNQGFKLSYEKEDCQHGIDNLKDSCNEETQFEIIHFPQKHYQKQEKRNLNHQNNLDDNLKHYHTNSKPSKDQNSHIKQKQKQCSKKQDKFQIDYKVQTQQIGKLPRLRLQRKCVMVSQSIKKYDQFRTNEKKDNQQKQQIEKQFQTDARRQYYSQLQVHSNNKKFIFKDQQPYRQLQELIQSYYSNQQGQKPVSEQKNSIKKEYSKKFHSQRRQKPMNNYKQQQDQIIRILDKSLAPLQLKQYLSESDVTSQDEDQKQNEIQNINSVIRNDQKFNYRNGRVGFSAHYINNQRVSHKNNQDSHVSWSIDFASKPVTKQHKSEIKDQNISADPKKESANKQDDLLKNKVYSLNQIKSMIQAQQKQYSQYKTNSKIEHCSNSEQNGSLAKYLRQVEQQIWKSDCPQNLMKRLYYRKNSKQQIISYRNIEGNDYKYMEQPEWSIKQQMILTKNIRWLSVVMDQKNLKAFQALLGDKYLAQFDTLQLKCLLRYRSIFSILVKLQKIIWVYQQHNQELIYFNHQHLRSINKKQSKIKYKQQVIEMFVKMVVVLTKDYQYASRRNKQFVGEVMQRQNVESKCNEIQIINKNNETNKQQVNQQQKFKKILLFQQQGLFQPNKQMTPVKGSSSSSSSSNCQHKQQHLNKNPNRSLYIPHQQPQQEQQQHFRESETSDNLSTAVVQTEHIYQLINRKYKSQETEQEQQKANHNKGQESGESEQDIIHVDYEYVSHVYRERNEEYQENKLYLNQQVQADYYEQSRQIQIDSHSYGHPFQAQETNQYEI